MTVDNFMWFAGGTVFGTLNMAWITYVFLFYPLLHRRVRRKRAPQE